jgi:hypothetical protein
MKPLHPPRPSEYAVLPPDADDYLGHIVITQEQIRGYDPPAHGVFPPSEAERIAREDEKRRAEQDQEWLEQRAREREETLSRIKSQQESAWDRFKEWGWSN